MKEIKRGLAKENVSQKVDCTWRDILDKEYYDVYKKMDLEPYRKNLELGLQPDDMPDPIFNYLQAVRELIKSWNGHLDK